MSTERELFETCWDSRKCVEGKEAAWECWKARAQTEPRAPRPSRLEVAAQIVGPFLVSTQIAYNKKLDLWIQCGCLSTDKPVTRGPMEMAGIALELADELIKQSEES